MAVDLHMHSTASDGTLTPAELVAEAVAIGLRAISLTDHDTVAGVPEAQAGAKDTGLDFLAGVEISTAPPAGWEIPGSIHVLAYGVDIENDALTQLLQSLQMARVERLPKMVARLNRLGIDISADDAKKIAGDIPVGRPHIARALVQKKAARDINDAFDRLIGNGRPGYVDKYRAPLDDVLHAIENAGGISVLAHSGLIRFGKKPSIEKTHDFIQHLAQRGLRGVEVYYPEHKASFIRNLLQWAGEMKLLVTGGTDFHGANKAGIQLGSGRGDFAVPDQVFTGLTEGLKR